MPCLILGDSIAWGLAQVFHGCAVFAQVGINAPAWEARYQPVAGRGAEIAVISLGSNPADGTSAALARIRARVRAPRVIWVVPVANNAGAVRLLAARYGDATITFQPARDGIHPRSYQALARDLSRAGPKTAFVG
jgi:hypothetical protein